MLRSALPSQNIDIPNLEVLIVQIIDGRLSKPHLTSRNIVDSSKSGLECGMDGLEEFVNPVLTINARISNVGMTRSAAAMARWETASLGWAAPLLHTAAALIIVALDSMCLLMELLGITLNLKGMVGVVEFGPATWPIHPVRELMEGHPPAPDAMVTVALDNPTFSSTLNRS